MSVLASHLSFFNTLSARKKDRQAGAQYLADHPEQWQALFAYGLNPQAERIHIILCWCAELYLVPQPDRLSPQLDTFLHQLALIQNESMRRSLSKILYYYVRHFEKQLTQEQKEQIITLAFDWLIAPAQVATLNFALKLLQILQKEAPWIREELRAIVKQQLPTASPGYRAAAREIFK